MIFVDTSAWFASVVPSDTNLIDETLTLLRIRGELSRALSLGEAFFSGELATIYYLTTEDIRQTWQVFYQFSDKA